MSRLNEVLAVLDEESINGSIDYPTLKKWMATDDLETLGAVYVLISEERFYSKIEPALGFDDYLEFLLKYFEKCIIQDTEGEWCDSRYSAGRDFVNWFSSWWVDPNISPDKLGLCKSWLASIYKSGTPEIRECIETGILEHLLDKEDVAKYFSDWKNAPVLKTGFELAVNDAKYN